MPTCEYEHCDEPIPEKRLRRNARFHTDRCRKHQWLLEDRRRQMSKAKARIVEAALEWYALEPTSKRKADQALERLYAACARHEKEQADA